MEEQRSVFEILKRRGFIFRALRREFPRQHLLIQASIFLSKKKSFHKKSVLCDAVIVNFSSIRYLFFKSFSLTVYESAKWQIFVSPSRLLRNLEQKKNEACLLLNEGKKRKKKLFCHDKKGANVVQFNCVLNTSSPQ